jgi:Transglycosylase
MARRWKLMAAVPLVAVVAAGAGYAGACHAAKNKIELAFAKRGFVAHVGSVRLTLHSAKVRGLTAMLSASPTGESADILVDDLEVSLDGSVLGSPTVREVRFGENRTTVHGALEDLVERFKSKTEADAEGSKTPGRRLPTVTGIHLVWEAPQGSVDITGLGIHPNAGPNGDQLELSVAHMEGKTAHGTFEADDARVAVEGALKRENLRSLTFGRLVLRSDKVFASVAGNPAMEPHEPKDPPLALGEANKKSVKPGAIAKEVALDFPTLPDWGFLRGQAEALGKTARDVAPKTFDLLVSKMSVETKDLSFGPGELKFARLGESVKASFVSDRTVAQTPLELRVDLPGPDVEYTIDLEGGPVSAASLGLRDGMLKLSDTKDSTVGGHAHLALAKGSEGLTFDVDIKAASLGLTAPKLSSLPLHGINAGVRARGHTSGTQVRLDDSAWSFGAFSFNLRGLLALDAKRASLRSTFSVPVATCQTLLDGMPKEMLPTLAGMKMSGTFAAQGQLVMDSAKLDDLDLRYQIDESCRATQVPEPLAKEHFAKPFRHRVYLADGKMGEETLGPGSSRWADFEQISPFMQASVLTTEDAGFRHHHGFSHRAIRDSLVANLKARKFFRGASTVSMQLAKNLFLTREKTLSRKLEELVLTDYLEETWSKDELMELYLNVVEFGPNVYGIVNASEYYFGRRPFELSLAECMFLASVLPSPSKFAGARDHGQLSPGWQKHIETLMKIAAKTGKISDADLSSGLGQTVMFRRLGDARPVQRPPTRGSRFEGEAPEGWQEVPDAPER